MLSLAEADIFITVSRSVIRLHRRLFVQQCHLFCDLFRAAVLAVFDPPHDDAEQGGGKDVNRDRLAFQPGRPHFPLFFSKAAEIEEAMLGIHIQHRFFFGLSAPLQQAYSYKSLFKYVNFLTMKGNGREIVNLVRGCP